MKESQRTDFGEFISCIEGIENFETNKIIDSLRSNRLFDYWRCPKNGLIQINSMGVLLKVDTYLFNRYILVTMALDGSYSIRFLYRAEKQIKTIKIFHAVGFDVLPETIHQLIYTGTEKIKK